MVCDPVLAHTKHRSVIVDPAGMDFIKGKSTSGAGGASGAIYTQIGLTTFPTAVTNGITKPGDAVWYRYTNSRLKKKEREVIHVVGPDFRRGRTTQTAAVKQLSKAYHSVLVCMVKRLLSGKQEQLHLRLLPISSGIFAGQFEKDMPQMTWQAVCQAFCALNAEQQSTLLNLKSVSMCVLKRDQCPPYREALIESRSVNAGSNAHAMRKRKRSPSEGPPHSPNYYVPKMHVRVERSILVEHPEVNTK